MLVVIEVVVVVFVTVVVAAACSSRFSDPRISIKLEECNEYIMQILNRAINGDL